ncbi:MAG: dihydropteroate synthase [Candidatus Omnitrophica bacterium]|nr:dihydropteroate synthase [Candidatus Omnitrophota bacterium]MCM8776756.1 dihydropteroate synthase [Candidatus Omnitrophota bacterium]
MIIIGELVNATRKSIAEAIEKKDRDYIKKVVLKQIEAGAHYIDLNAGTGKGQEREISDMKWLMDIVNEIGEIPVCVDSSDPIVIGECLDRIKSKDRMINSINGENKRIEELLPVIKRNNECKIIGLTMDDSGIPVNVEKRIEITGKIVKLLEDTGVLRENIFIDPLVQPISVDVKNGMIFLESIRMIKKEFPGIKTTCGLSNVSFGLPKRKLLNKYFLALSIAFGLDSAIIDPVDEGMREVICVSEALTGKDEYCMNYIKMCRQSS